MEEEPSCYHLFIYKILKIQSEGKVFIRYDCVRDIMRRRFHKIPRVLHIQFLKEMEKYKLIKRNGNTKNIFYELIADKKTEKLINKYDFLC